MAGKSKAIDNEAISLLRSNPPRRAGGMCTFSANPDARVLAAALYRNGGQYIQIARILKSRGVDTTSDTVSRHLNGECKCPPS